MNSPQFWRFALTVPAIVFSVAGCQGNTSALVPHGPNAEAISNLWWFMFVIALVVFVVTMALLAIAVFRRGGDTDRQAPPPQGSYTFILVLGVVIPLVILLALFGYTLRTMVVLAAPADDEALTIQVIGHQWWWEVRYIDNDFETANELHIPVGEPVRVQLTSADVIHSFWVPELHGKIDLIPGQTNTIWIEASEPGAYRGICAEYCGLQHAKMQFYVVAVNAEDFSEWVTVQQRPAPVPANDLTSQGLQVFLGSACVYCHTIRGTNAVSDLGPDLTHFASRLTIGAGAVPNTAGHLAGWIVDSHGIKPGNYMPPMYLESEDLNALLAYMQTLH